MLACSEETLIPFIARYAENQIEMPLDNNFSTYDERQDVTIAAKSGQPLVNLSPAVTETMTKTEAARESEDTAALSLLALETATAVKREAPDFDYAFSEFLTKTKAARESDESQYSLFELMTETRVARESSDPQNPTLLL